MEVIFPQGVSGVTLSYVCLRSSSEKLLPKLGLMMMGSGNDAFGRTMAVEFVLPLTAVQPGCSYTRQQRSVWSAKR